MTCGTLTQVNELGISSSNPLPVKALVHLGVLMELKQWLKSFNFLTLRMVVFIILGTSFNIYYMSSRIEGVSLADAIFSNLTAAQILLGMLIMSVAANFSVRRALRKETK